MAGRWLTRQCGLGLNTWLKIGNPSTRSQIREQDHLGHRSDRHNGVHRGVTPLPPAKPADRRDCVFQPGGYWGAELKILAGILLFEGEKPQRRFNTFINDDVAELRRVA
jgi:hypothetical protein